MCPAYNCHFTVVEKSNSNFTFFLTLKMKLLIDFNEQKRKRNKNKILVMNITTTLNFESKYLNHKLKTHNKLFRKKILTNNFVYYYSMKKMKKLAI